MTYEMLTGCLPFRDDDVSRRFSPKPVLSPPSDAHISREALQLLSRSLSSEPSLRPVSIAEMSEQLAREVESGWRPESKRRTAAICFLVVLAIAAWLVRERLGGSEAKYERVVEVQSGYDPTNYQFREVNQITGQAAFNADNSGFEGFREMTNSQGFLVHPFTAAQQQAAMRKGWILSGRIRAEQGGAFLIADFDRVNRRYDIFVFRSPNGGTGVRLIDRLIPSLRGPEVVIPDRTPALHDYKMRYDSRSGTASLAVDNQVVLSGYRGHSEYVNPYGLVMGVSRYLGERGISTFAGARFEILP